jgi:hypothetical protein
VTVEIDWDGDGFFEDTIPLPAGSTAFSATNIYDEPGTYTVTLRATDKDGGVATDTVNVTVDAATGQIQLFDSIGPTDTVLLFNADPFTAAVIASAQSVYLVFRRLCELGFPWACALAEQALRFVEAVVPAHARYTLRAPDLGTGDVSADVTIRAEDGGLTGLHNFVLRETGAGSVASNPFIAVPTGSRLISGDFGPLSIFAADPDGSLLAQAPPFDESSAKVASPAVLAAKLPLGSLVYDTTVTRPLEAPGDTDHIGFPLDAGQTLTVDLRPEGSTGLQLAAKFVGPDGAALATGVAPEPGRILTLQTVPVVNPGTYRVEISGVGDTLGNYRFRTVLNGALEMEPDGGNNDSAATAQDLDPFLLTVEDDALRGSLQGSADGGPADFFSFSLSSGDRTTLAITDLLPGLSTGNLDVLLLDENGNVVASSSPAGNVDRVITDFVAGVSGRYYARVTGDTGVPYNLVATKNAAFDVEQLLAQAVVPLGVNRAALGFLGCTRADVKDSYSLELDVEQVIRGFSRTPGDGLGQFANTLNPRLRLLDPAGREVATGTVLPDGRNKEFKYIVPSIGGGTYTIELTSEAGSRGEYSVVLK